MTIYYVPKTETVTMASGKKLRLIRGVTSSLPTELVNSAQANKIGIKPVGEMTAAERRLLGLK